MSRKKRRGPATVAAGKPATPQNPPSSPAHPASINATWIPAAVAAALVLLSFLGRVQANVLLVRSFWMAAAALLIWTAVVYLRRGTAAGALALSAPRAQHYVQATVQLSVFAYWGWYWRPVYDFAPLLLAQLLFAYAFGMLLSWTRGQKYVLGFGPFPILFSINLFLWFKDEWFWLQFLLLAVGLAGKEYIRWNREGKSVHIFNPSALPLALAAILLIATGTTDITWGPEIASTLGMGPHVYKVLFIGGLVVMYFFNITLLTAAAAATLFGLSAIYSGITGVPYFLDSEIPSAVFLGIHLLVTDPSTSPRSPMGKTIFGVMYGVGVFTLYALLGAIGAPTFYDKLLCVPLLNLSVRGIERWVRSVRVPPVLAHMTASSIPRPVNIRYMAAWIVFFVVMTFQGRTDGRHTGDSLPFWQQACAENRPTACRRLVNLEATYCSDNSAWACNELGVVYREGRVAPAEPDRALSFLSKACELRFQAACLNLLEPNAVVRAPPRPLDLRLLLREGGRNLMDMPEPDLYARACEHRWEHTCRRVAARL